MKNESFNREKDLITLVPSQISPNPIRKKGIANGNTSPLSENSQPSSISATSTEATKTFCSEPLLNFENLLEKRHGSVLGHEIIIKSEHFFKGN
jgi:hypothetical protein